MQVGEILDVKGREIYTTAPERTLQEAVAEMTERDVGSLVVMADGLMVGMLTFREVLTAIRTAGKDWQGVLVKDTMIREPHIGKAHMGIDELRRQMIEHHQRYLPIMDGDTVMGVVSFLDVARAVLEEQGFENRMLKNYIRNWPEADTGDAPEQ